MRLKNTYLLMILATFFWSGAFIAGKLSVPYLPPFTLTFFRFILATLFLYLYIKFTGKKLYSLKLKDVPIFAFTGLVGMFGYHILFFISLKYTSAINASIIGSTNPIVTTLLALLFLNDRVSINKIIGILLSVTGVFLTITGGNISLISSMTFNKGDLIMLVAVLMWASYSVFSKKFSDRFSPIDLTFYSFLFCTIFLVPFVIFENPINSILTAPLSCYTAVIYMSFFASFIGYLLQQVSIREIGASSTNTFINLVPVFSMILSIIILKESFSLAKASFSLLIIIGVFVSQYKPKYIKSDLNVK